MGNCNQSNEKFCSGLGMEWADGMCKLDPKGILMFYNPINMCDGNGGFCSKCSDPNAVECPEKSVNAWCFPAGGYHSEYEDRDKYFEQCQPPKLVEKQNQLLSEAKR